MAEEDGSEAGWPGWVQCTPGCTCLHEIPWPPTPIHPTPQHAHTTLGVDPFPHSQEVDCHHLCRGGQAVPRVVRHRDAAKKDLQPRRRGSPQKWYTALQEFGVHRSQQGSQDSWDR